MATRIFPWGTVRNTPKGVSFALGLGIRFDLVPEHVDAVERWIQGTKIHPHLYPTATVLNTSAKGFLPAANYKDILYMEWSTFPSPITVKSVLKLGYGIPKYLSAFYSTPTILNYNEAMELAIALRDVKNLAPVKAAQASPTP